MEPSADLRCLVLGPTPRDTELTVQVLARAGIDCCPCRDVHALFVELDRGAGVAIVAEDAVGDFHADMLGRWLAGQPTWSDLPLLVAARHRADSPAVARAMEQLGNVTVLETPLRMAGLISAVRAAIRARVRQYQLRDQVFAVESKSRELRQGVEEMRTLLDTLPIGVFTATDPDCRHVVGNRAASELIRAEPGENVSRSARRSARFTITRDGEEVPADDLPLRRAARGEEVRNEALEIRFHDGTVAHTLNSAAGLYAPDQRIRGAVCAALDITVLRRQEELLREADRRKDEFLATLAHELRNPLAPIRNSLHILRLREPGDPGRLQVLEMMERQVGHMVRLVDDLLEVSRITQGKIKLRQEVVAVAELVRNAVDTCRPLIEAQGHDLCVTLPPEPLWVSGDPVRLTQVFANLLNNAARYTPPGGRLDIRALAAGGDLEVAVADNGIGIAPALLPRVFDLFTQGSEPAIGTGGGLGIGLTLVKSLTELHRGTVAARSAGAGRGSTFTVRLPLASAPGAGLPEADQPGALARRRMLVVDDNEDAAESLGLLLKLLGASVTVVHAGVEALAALEHETPEVMLVDLGMPGMDGCELARRVRARPEFGAVKLVAVTGWSQPADRSRSRQAGFDHHLAKPVDLRMLEELLAAERDRAIP